MHLAPTAAIAARADASRMGAADDVREAHGPVQIDLFQLGQPDVGFEGAYPEVNLAVSGGDG